MFIKTAQMDLHITRALRELEDIKTLHQVVLPRWHHIDRGFLTSSQLRKKVSKKAHSGMSC